MSSLNISNNVNYRVTSNKQQSYNNSAVSNSYAQNPNATSFKGESGIIPNNIQMVTPTSLIMKTQLTTKEEQEKFITIFSQLTNKQDKQNLALLLKRGILLNTNSNDKSSTLDNLHKIATTERLKGLNTKNILSETINTIANPFVITQNFGDIPKQYINEITQKAQANPKTPDNKIDVNTIDVKNSSACVSASIEFILAKQMPAEFTRFVEGLTSPKMAVEKTINLKNLTDNTLDSVYLLNTFEIPYEMSDFDTAKLTLAPDKNASIRAQIQNVDKNYSERSLIDVLMQSTFMNVGSQGTYDSLTDLRGGKFNNDNKGLIEFEKTFTESIVLDKNKISVTYQNLDENAKLIGYTADFKTIEKQILDSIAIGESVIIGYTEFDDSGKVINGHEITIIGSMRTQNGDLIFICNDTDDNRPTPIAYPAKLLIPKIHHAGLPQKIAEQNPISNTASWKEGIEAYKQIKQKAV